MIYSINKGIRNNNKINQNEFFAIYDQVYLWILYN